MSLASKISATLRPSVASLDGLAPLADLLIRLWAAKFFFDSALTKIQFVAEFPFVELGPSTILLFQYEYNVPLLAPAAAAYLGTGAELIFPALLALGLAGRLSALALLVFNIVAVVSYPGLNAAGHLQHLLYGTLLLLPVLRGPGTLSIDFFLRRHYFGDVSVSAGRAIVLAILGIAGSVFLFGNNVIAYIGVAAAVATAILGVIGARR